MGFEFYILLGFFIVLFSLGLVGMVLSVRYKHAPIVQPAHPDTVQGNPEAGNVFFAIFGALALVGILGAATMTFMKGPLSSAVKLTKLNTAEVQMTIGSQVAVMSTTSQANSGDCDSDGFVEPMDWRAATTEPIPTNGGLIPLSLGISKKDPWGTEYGYCVWNHGPTTSGGTCGANMLTGTNSTAYPVVALVSAGPDKTFTTTCRSFASADSNSDGDLDDAGDDPLVSKAAETDDDVIHTFTYEEATAASGGLWSLKSGDPATAVIDKKIETTGTASLAGGVLLPDSSLITCDATTAGVMAKNASGTGIEICDGTGSWTSISGGSGASSSFATSSATCDATTAGSVRYNNVTTQPEFCNGSQWLPFSINIPGVNLVLSPTNQTSMDVDANSNVDPHISGICDDGIYFCGNPITFTLQNQGTVISATLSVSLTNSTYFYIKSNTCTVGGGNTDGKLDPNESCSIIVIPKANGNTAYTGNLQITANNNPFAIMQGTASHFGCYPGRIGAGGRYVACGLSSVAGTYDLIITPGNCTDSTNPTCSGTGYDSVTRIWGAQAMDSYSNRYFPYNDTNGAQSTADIVQYGLLTGQSYPAAQWCYDLNYGGYSDWYLPAYYEFQNYIFPQKAVLTGFYMSDPGVANDYWTSTYYTSDYNYAYYGDTVNGMSNTGRWGLDRVRCARRDGLTFPSPTADTNPTDVSFSPQVTFSPSSTATSNAVTVTGILQSISATITGGTGMDIIKNGVSTSSTSVSSIKPGDTLAFKMQGPAIIGTKNTATITIGDDTYTWWVGYADSSRTARVFVTSAATGILSGNLGGPSGADTLCNSRAAASPLGLPAKWKAILSTSTTNASQRIPWNWGTLERLDGVDVVTGGFSDLWDGTLLNPIEITEMLTTRSGAIVRGNTNSFGEKNPSGAASPYGYGDTYDSCHDWTSSNDYGGDQGGNSSVANSQWISGTWRGCTGHAEDAIYCIEDIEDTSDVLPASINIPYSIQVPTSSRQASSSIAISGMSPGATTTLSVSATGGNPAFTVNGGAEVTSATVQNGDNIIFKMDAPATGNSSYKMTITSGGSSTLGIWRVWTGDITGSATKRVFVTSGTYYGDFGGLVSADSTCQSVASSASLGGTWKAIISGIAENEYAINRVGYNWSTLTLVDGTVVTYAGGLWNTATTPFLSPIVKTQTGALKTSASVFSNTEHNGMASATVSSEYYNCWNWSSTPVSTHFYGGNTSATGTAWSKMYYWGGCYNQSGFYCIEQ